MGDIYRILTDSGKLILSELNDGEGTAIDELLATGTGYYDVYVAEDLGNQQTWEIIA